MKIINYIIIASFYFMLTLSCTKKDKKIEDQTSPELTIDCSDLNGVWVEIAWQYNDSGSTSYSYGCDNDGYCCGAVEVNVSGSSFNVNDTILVNGLQYKISLKSNNNSGCFTNDNHMENFRCGLALSMIEPPQNSKHTLVLGKRRND
ncbi:hypothetical protein [Brumimicrobium mesophilum]|uniref:hypothetical protein n=1 Tax=Brumimicrobium mesophilum TaxID=392717 RepID=UPI000D144E7D|nr:hypothetical protein [Brumimicrobium mesophilum]